LKDWSAEFNSALFSFWNVVVYNFNSRKDDRHFASFACRELPFSVQDNGLESSLTASDRKEENCERQKA
jgi:hypothetical protein